MISRAGTIGAHMSIAGMTGAMRSPLDRTRVLRCGASGKPLRLTIARAHSYEQAFVSLPEEADAAKRPRVSVQRRCPEAAAVRLRALVRARTRAEPARGARGHRA